MTNAFEKRVKRRVSSKTMPFFAVTAPHSEPVTFKELKTIFAMSFIPNTDPDTIPVSVENGGVAFSAKLPEMYKANLFSATANRILMRVAEFKATGFAELKKKAAKTDWELFLPSKSLLEIRVTSKKSRLINTEAVMEQMLSAISQKTDITGGNRQTLFVRAVKDVFTLSLDTSGSILYKRGIKTMGGKAPIRETLAAAILLKAGFVPGMPVVDPMAGSGAFGVEAAMMTENIPSGKYREFAFMDWPSFRPATWAHLKKEVEKGIRRVRRPLIFSSDKDESQMKTLMEINSAYGFSSLAVECADFFSLSPEKKTGGDKGLVVMNPPYGKRIGNAKETSSFYKEIFKKLAKDYKGWNAAVIYPETPDVFKKTPTPLGFTPYPLFHGGLHISVLMGKV